MTSVGLSSAQISEAHTIVHAVPRRIRLRIQRLADDFLFIRRLETLSKNDSYVIRFRVNRAAASVIIYYDVCSLSEIDLGQHLLNIIKQAEGEYFSIS